MAGPFEITKQISNLYEVKLLKTMKIYNVFSPDCLRKAADNLLPGQVNKPLLLVVIIGNKEYEVEEVLAVKKLRSNRLLYRVKWLGYDEDLEWYPASNLKYSPHKLRDYHLQHKTEPGPPRKLDQ